MRTSGVLLRPAFAPGGATGLGHVARALALGAAIAARGARATLLAPLLPESWAERARAAGVTVVASAAVPGGRDDGLETRAAAHRSGASWVVLDGYDFTPAMSEAIDHPIVAFADLGQGATEHAALVIDPNYGARAEPYAAARRQLLGLAFAPLRPEFARLSRAREPRASAREVLCTFGGSDPCGLTEIAIAAAAKSELHFTVLLGADNARPFHALDNVTLLRDVSDLAALALQADLAVIAAGTTLWELLCLQTPLLTCWIHPNQREIVNALSARGACRALGDARALGAAGLARAISALAQDAGARGLLGQAGGALIDGRGAERIADVLLEAR